MGNYALHRAYLPCVIVRPVVGLRMGAWGITGTPSFHARKFLRFIILKGEYYDAIKDGRKTTEYRDLSPRNLAKSIGIKTVKLQRGYEQVQMRYEVKSVGLLDADDRECDPYNIPPGFFATTIAIHLGKRIG